MTVITPVRWKNMDGIRLENDWLTAVVLPQLGGKIASVFYKEKAFEMVSQNSSSGYLMPEKNGNFSLYDASGLDDAFPNISEAQIMKGEELWHYPDHGEIWSASFEWQIEGETLMLRYESSQFHYSYQKSVSLNRDSVCLSYAISNVSEAPLPCIWAFHGLFRYEEDMEFLYADGVRGFENVYPSLELGAPGRHLPMCNTEYDFSRVPDKNSRTMVKYYVDDKIGEGFCGYRYPSQKVECVLRYDAKKLPFLGVWVTAGGYRGDYNCALEPSNGYYDDIRIAKHNKTVHLLKKEKPLEFTIEIRLYSISS